MVFILIVAQLAEHSQLATALGSESQDAATLMALAAGIVPSNGTLFNFSSWIGSNPCQNGVISTCLCGWKGLQRSDLIAVWCSGLCMHAAVEVGVSQPLRADTEASVSRMHPAAQTACRALHVHNPGWHHVFCDSNMRVSRVELGGLALTGSIPTLPGAPVVAHFAPDLRRHASTHARVFVGLPAEYSSIECAHTTLCWQLMAWSSCGGLICPTTGCQGRCQWAWRDQRSHTCFSAATT